MRISKGSQMREQKKQSVTYTFTQEQLAQRDKAVIQEYKDRIMADMHRQADEINAEVQENIKQEWAAREKLFSSRGFDDNLVEIIALLISISARTLVEDFKWEALPKDGNYRRSRKLYRFCEAVAKRIMDICADENNDIRSYNDETYELYGVRFTAVEVENEK